MLVFLAIMTCASHAERDAAIRETWLPRLVANNPNVEPRFVFGCITGGRCGADSLHLSVADGRHRLAPKFYTLVQVVYASGFDYLITFGQRHLVEYVSGSDT